MDESVNVIDARVMHHFPNGVPEGENVSHAVKRYHEVASLYEHPRQDDPVVYEVYTHDEGPKKPGNLLWGLTIMKPVDSNGECNMTRGHFHVDRNCTEYYFCLRGEGLLLLMDESGHTWAERMSEGSLHHIDGHLAHRCVNTSLTEELWIGACWPTVSGHDYESVEAREFGYRVKRNADGELVFEQRGESL
jgi:glucose-6-phosphate isomerase